MGIIKRKFEDFTLKACASVWWSFLSRCFGASGLLSLGRCGRSEKLGMMGED